MTYKLPEPVQIDKHITTGIVIRGYTAKHVLDAYTAGMTESKTQIELLKTEIKQLQFMINKE